LNGTLNSSRAPSLRWRLLLLVSISSLVVLVLASSMSYRRARHEVQELMDDQLAKTAQLVLAQAQTGDDHLSDLPARIAGIHGLKSRRNQLTLEYQIARKDGVVLARSPNAPAAVVSGPLGYATFGAEGESWRTLTLESADRTIRVQIAESIPVRDKEALEIAVKTAKPLWLTLPLLLLAIYFSVRRGLKPLDELASEVATRSPDNLSPLAARAVPREAQPLVAAINRVFYRLDSALENERRFTADAAHELRTPLAAARIQAQVAQIAESRNSVRTRWRRPSPASTGRRVSSNRCCASPASIRSGGCRSPGRSASSNWRSASPLVCRMRCPRLEFGSCWRTMCRLLTAILNYWKWLCATCSTTPSATRRPAAKCAWSWRKALAGGCCRCRTTAPAFPPTNCRACWNASTAVRRFPPRAAALA
jgi:hypothetical protein